MKLMGLAIIMWLSCVCRCDSIGKVQNKLDYLRMLLNDQVTFKSIYRYAYDFARVKDAVSFLCINCLTALNFILICDIWGYDGSKY